MSLVGKLLIAHPNVPTGNPFHRAVVYLYQDNPSEGSIGVILNKPSKFTIQDVCKDKGIEYPWTKKVIYHGGPVTQNALVLLHTNDWSSSNTVHAGMNLCVSSDNVMFEKLSMGDEPLYWRLFGGMCGWAPGQLEAEMKGKWPYRAENSWLTADATDTFIFSTEGDKQWQQAFELSSTQLFDQYW